MSELTDRQAAFASAVARLILHAERLGYRVRFGDCYRDPRCPYGHPQSAHKNRLAVDLMLDIRTGLNGEWVFQQESEAYLPLGEWWEAEYKQYAAAWGGRFQKRDGNHFSFSWDGVK